MKNKTLLYLLLLAFLPIVQLNLMGSPFPSLHTSEGGPYFLAVQVLEGIMGVPIYDVGISCCGYTGYTNRQGIAHLPILCDGDQFQIETELSGWEAVSNITSAIPHPKLAGKDISMVTVIMAREENFESELQKFALAQKILNKVGAKASKEIEEKIKAYLDRFGNLYQEYAQAITPAYRKELRKEVAKADINFAKELKPIMDRHIEIGKAGRQLGEIVSKIHLNDPTWNLVLERVMVGEIEQSGQVLSDYFQSQHFSRQPDNLKETMLSMGYILSQVGENESLKTKVLSSAQKHGFKKDISRIDKGNVLVSQEGILMDSTKKRLPRPKYLTLMVAPGGVTPTGTSSFPISFGPAAYLNLNRNSLSVSQPSFAIGLGVFIKPKRIREVEITYENFSADSNEAQAPKRIRFIGISMDTGWLLDLSEPNRKKLKTLKLLTSVGLGLKYGSLNAAYQIASNQDVAFSFMELRSRIELILGFQKFRVFTGIRGALSGYTRIGSGFFGPSFSQPLYQFHNALVIGIRYPLNF